MNNGEDDPGEHGETDEPGQDESACGFVSVESPELFLSSSARSSKDNLCICVTPNSLVCEALFSSIETELTPPTRGRAQVVVSIDDKTRLL